jgi:hypothetical protein
MVARAFLGMLDEASSVKLLRTGKSQRARRAQRKGSPQRDITFGGGMTAAGEAAG